jgi:hypothetical protein
MRQEYVEPDTSIYIERLGSSPPPAPARRMGRARVALALLLVAAVAFLAGIRVDKWRNKPAGGLSSLAAAFAQARAGRGGAGAGGAGTFGGGATLGQVRLVDGSTIYVTDGQGNILKVTTNAGSVFTKTSAASLGDIRPGDSVAVSGEQQRDGSMAASRVADSGPSQSGG